MRSFHRALLGFSNLKMHFFHIIYFNCGYMSKIRSPSLQMESLTRCLGGCIFPVPEDVDSFLIYFGLNTNLAYISKLGEEDLVVYNYLFTSQREPHSVPDRDFFATLLLISSHFELSRIELPKLTSSILMEIVTILVVLVDQFYFYMHHQPIKPWLFEKNYLLS